MGESLPVAEARQVLDAQDLVLTPGLIDVHVRIYDGVFHYGINAHATCLQKGATTAGDAGSSGAQTFPRL